MGGGEGLGLKKVIDYKNLIRTIVWGFYLLGDSHIDLTSFMIKQVSGKYHKLNEDILGVQVGFH
jgi:hypothetical protein